jgi:hypothetical protein
MGVIQRMGMVATDKDEKPKYPIIIHKATAYRGIPPEDHDYDNERSESNWNGLAITSGT